MATYSDVLGELKTILNRDDCTDAQYAVFIGQALQRIQRDIKLPSMERSAVVTALADITYIQIPTDLLQVIDIMTDDWAGRTFALERYSYRELCRIPTIAPPQGYARLQNTFQIRGLVKTGAAVNVLYYGTITPLVNLTDTNEITSTAPDLLVYASLSFAGDNFEMPQTQTWEQRYQSILGQVREDVIALENTGGPAVMQPFYTWES